MSRIKHVQGKCTIIYISKFLFLLLENFKFLFLNSVLFLWTLHPFLNYESLCKQFRCNWFRWGSANASFCDRKWYLNHRHTHWYLYCLVNYIHTTVAETQFYKKSVTIWCAKTRMFTVWSFSGKNGLIFWPRILKQMFLTLSQIKIPLYIISRS